MVILFAVDGYANTLHSPAVFFIAWSEGSGFLAPPGLAPCRHFGVASPRGASADELPAELQRRKKRLAAIEEVKARLEPTRRAGASPPRTVHPSGAGLPDFRPIPS